MQILNRSEMKYIMAGSSGSCRIFINGSWGGCDHDASNAADWYTGFDEVTGYCCASCGEGNFSNAAPCPSTELEVN